MKSQDSHFEYDCFEKSLGHIKTEFLIEIKKQDQGHRWYKNVGLCHFWKCEKLMMLRLERLRIFLSLKLILEQTCLVS